MNSVFELIQIIISVCLILLILTQAKGVGLGHAWGGSGDFYKSRRGVEKLVFRITILMAILFLASSLVNLLV